MPGTWWLDSPGKQVGRFLAAYIGVPGFLFCLVSLGKLIFSINMSEIVSAINWITILPVCSLMVYRLYVYVDIVWEFNEKAEKIAERGKYIGVGGFVVCFVMFVFLAASNYHDPDGLNKSVLITFLGYEESMRFISLAIYFVSCSYCVERIVTAHIDQSEAGMNA